MPATMNERAGAIHLALPWRGIFPIPDGIFTANDRAEAAGMYGVRFSPLITSSQRLQNPVDCVLAGNQTDEKSRSPLNVRRGHATHRALRGIFGER